MGLSPVLIAALINEIAIPELGRWLQGLHAEGKLVTEAEALAKLNSDIDDANAAGHAFLDAHPKV